MPRADDVVRLSEFRGEGSQLMLRGQAASADLFIPLSSARRVESAEVELHLVNSIALIEDRSVLRVNFNGVTVGQIRLRRDRPEILATVTLPASLWEPGFNRLQFAASQQVEAECASPEAPELWTEIDLYASHLRVEHRPAAAALALADLSGILGTGIGSARRVTLLTAPDANDGALDRALPMLAQALALRRNYAPLQLRHRQWQAELSVHRRRLGRGRSRRPAGECLLLARSSRRGSACPGGTARPARADSARETDPQHRRRPPVPGQDPGRGRRRQAARARHGAPDSQRRHRR